MLSSMTEKKDQQKISAIFPKQNSLCNKWIIWIKLPQIYGIPNLEWIIGWISINICEMSTSILGV